MNAESRALAVMIVGAGPTGLLLAVELAAQGIPVRIIDKSAQASTKSKALVVQVRTLEIFERLGVIKEALQRGKALEGLCLQTSAHRTLDVRFEEIKSPYPFPLILEQSQNEAILNEKLNSFGVYVERQQELVELTQDQEGVVARVKDVQGKLQEIRARWLVGCDGAHSIVRHQLGFSFAGKSYDQQFVLADIGMDWSLGSEKLCIFVSRRGFMAVAPLPHNNLFRLITTETNLGLDHDPTLAELQALADRLIPVKTRIYLGSGPQSWTARFKISCRKVRHFGSGRVFLAGDAAHIHSPAGGLGMNTGLQDAYNLAWKLALVCRGEASPELLKTYELEREPIATRLLQTTDRLFFGIGGGVNHPVLKFVQAHLLPLFFGFGPVRRRLLKIVSQLAVNYAKSPIVLKGSPTGQGIFRPGYRLPNLDLLEAPDQSKRTLWQLVETPKHHILCFGAAAQPFTLHTSIPHEMHYLSEKICDMGSQTVIVRPDGYIGGCFNGFDSSKITAYFARIECRLARP